MEHPKVRLTMRVSRRTIYGNVLLAGFKLFAGVYAGSAAMLSDAVHTLSDILSTFVVMAGVKLAGRRPDKEHPYGHERFECVAAILLAMLLGVTGAMIGWDGVAKVAAGDYGELSVPGVLALAAAVVSVAVKEGMYWYTRRAAKQTGSGALMADAWHHRSDALSSVGSFAGILGARLGFPILDPLACVIICVFILKAAFSVFRDAVSKLTDRAADDALVAELRAAILKQDRVLGIDTLKTRLFGDRLYVDVEIALDGSLSLRDAHGAAQQVHDALEQEFPRVKHCMVHCNPAATPPEPPRR